MKTIDLSGNLVATDYGSEDQWVTASNFELSRLRRDNQARDTEYAGQWVELIMYCRYTRNTERFSVFYQGPAGACRVEHGGPQVPGPHGSLSAQATIIAATPVARAVCIEVEAGDVLVLNGQRMVITDDSPRDYPKLITEREAGIAAARKHIRAMHVAATEQVSGDHDDRIRRAAQADILLQVCRELDTLAASQREHYQ